MNFNADIIFHYLNPSQYMWSFFIFEVVAFLPFLLIKIVMNILKHSALCFLLLAVVTFLKGEVSGQKLQTISRLLIYISNLLSRKKIPVYGLTSHVWHIFAIAPLQKLNIFKSLLIY